MHVKLVTLDGFKSYSKLTKVERFDPSFNAITGLNGSGKSNILDAICFVLGIRNLTAVRANQLQDLVYKSGQAGIKEAAVSITFDNADKTRSPKGYEEFREITVTRKFTIGSGGKYLINGMKKPERTVFDLFATVSLNVNNPHFLIMQGRINKVINMRPMEILGLLEEAAGTKFFQKKKQEAERLIERKKEKMGEIDELLEKHILPKVAKLKQEKEKYQEFQRLKIRVTTGHKMLVAIKHRDLTTSLAEAEELVGGAERKRTEAQDRKATKANTLHTLDAEVQELVHQIANESDNHELEDSVKQMKDLHMRKAQDFKAQKDELEALRKERREKEESRDADAKEAVKKEKELAKKERELGGAENTGEEDLRKIEEADAELEDLRQGRFRGKDGAPAQTLAQQSLAAKDALNKAKVSLMTTQRAMAANAQRLKELERDLAKAPAADDREKAQAQTLTAQVAKARADVQATGFDQGRWEELNAERGNARRAAGEAQQRLGRWEQDGKNAKLLFPLRQRYSEEQVPGPAAALMACQDVDRFGTALDTAAGADLLSVVIAESRMSTEILNGWRGGRLKMLPLDRVAPRTINPNKLRDVRRVAERMGGECWEARELVEVDERFAQVRDYILGNKLICTSNEIATEICYRHHISTFTLTGDSYNPAGTISGGAQRSQGPTTLARVRELRQLQEALALARRADQDLQAELAALDGARGAAETQQRRLAQLENQLLELETRLESNERGRLEADIRRVEAETEGHRERLATHQAASDAAAKDVHDAEEKQRNQDNLKNNRIKELKKIADDARKRMEANKKNYVESKQVLDTLREELRQLREAVAKAEEELEAGREELAAKEAALQTAQDAVAEEDGRLKQAQEALEKYKAKLKERDALLKRKQKEATKLRDEVQALEVQMAELANDLERAQGNQEAYTTQMEALLRAEAWVEAEKHLFGKKEGGYNYGTRTLEEETRAQANDRGRFDELKKTVNTAAMARLQETQNKAEELQTKRARLDKDKDSLESAIVELDLKKEQKIREAFDFVTTNFGKIFSTLLPKAEAKLVCTADGDPLKGIEFRIGFSGHWKESLSELSGGQKSLVALSLVLAMLKYKPAPIYILDEVDAALDLSHTQNIGEMIKRNFPESQFIIVSLKEGMFNNANVLFKTRFVDGCSTVTRHEPSIKAPAAASKKR